MRRWRIRFGATPGADARARFAEALRAISPAPALRWEDAEAQVDYAFPETGSGEIWNALCAADLDRNLDGTARMVCALRALFEQNEREFLERPSGWRRHVDRLYLACGTDPAAPVPRRGGLWRKHERNG